MGRAFRATSDGEAVGMAWNGLLSLVLVAVLSLGVAFAVHRISSSEDATPIAGTILPDSSHRSPLHQLYLDSKAESESQPTHTIVSSIR